MVAKTGELNPARSPTDVARADTDAQCALGIPPVLTSAAKSMRPVRLRVITILVDCAINHPAAAHHTEVFAYHAKSDVMRLRLYEVARPSASTTNERRHPRVGSRMRVFIGNRTSTF